MQNFDCQHCSHPVNEEGGACELCGSRHTPFGYLYEHEYEELRRAVIFLAIIIGAAVLFLIGFFIYTRSALLVASDITLLEVFLL
jgi:hypothetical protein